MSDQPTNHVSVIGLSEHLSMLEAFLRTAREVGPMAALARRRYNGASRIALIDNIDTRNGQHKVQAGPAQADAAKQEAAQLSLVWFQNLMNAKDHCLGMIQRIESMLPAIAQELAPLGINIQINQEPPKT